MNKILCIFCIIVFLFKTETVFSKNLIYDVNNVEVSGKIATNFDNKKLIELAFEKAFIIFINKTLLSNDAKRLNNTEIKIIKDLIFTYQIIENKVNEKKEKLLTVNIKFNPKKINNFLAKKNISYADISNISLTILPVLVKEKNLFIFTGNFFYDNWIFSRNKNKIKSDSFISYNLALENIEDLEYINKNKKKLELIDLNKIISFDNKKNYAFLIIYLTENKLKAYIKTIIDSREINKIINLEVYPENEFKSYQNAISLIKKEISQIWKEHNLIDLNTPSFLDIYLETKNVNDYLKLRSVLDSMDLIESHFVLEITNSYSKVRIKYKGKLNTVRNKILEKKINVQIIDNIWKLKIK